MCPTAGPPWIATFGVSPYSRLVECDMLIFGSAFHLGAGGMFCKPPQVPGDVHNVAQCTREREGMRGVSSVVTYTQQPIHDPSENLGVHIPAFL